jgi:hypothetical protein
LKYLIGGGVSIIRADRFAILKSSTSKSGVQDCAAAKEVNRKSILKLLFLGKMEDGYCLGWRASKAQPSIDVNI